MTFQGFKHYTARAEYRRFMISLLVLMLVLFVAAFPELAHAAWDGKFGPSSELKTNTNDSLKGWFQAFAGWGLWISIGALAISILFFGGRFWWIPVCFCVVCLFGEPMVTQVGQWAGFNTK